MFKTLIQYKSFADCKDLARLTVETDTLEAMTETTAALLACEQLPYVRMKDRWPENYDVGKTGGYRQVGQCCMPNLYALFALIRRCD